MGTLINATCPKCGKEMEGGYIYSPRQIMWADDDKKKVFAIGDETLVGISMGFIHKKVRAYRCGDCKIVTFEYGSSI